MCFLIGGKHLLDLGMNQDLAAYYLVLEFTLVCITHGPPPY